MELRKNSPRPHARGNLLARRLGPLTRGRWCLLVLVALLLYGVELGHARALTQHEVYLAGPAKQMVQEGNWIVLKIGDRPWLEKPPLPHWLAAASATLLGGFTELSVRLPSALAGVGVVLVVAWISARLFGPRIGFLAGLVQASTQYMIAYARLAEADMCLLLIVLGAIAAFVAWRQLPETASATTRRLWLIAFWTFVGMTNLAKGPLFGAVLVLLTCAGWLFVCRDWPNLRRLAASPWGLLSACGLTVLWPFLVIIQEPAALDLWHSHLFGRATTGIGYDQPFYYYLTTWPVQLLPWTPLLFFAAGPSLRRAWRDPRSPDGFAWWWVLSHMFVLSLSSGKHHHYLIYGLPALSPIIGLGLVRCGKLNALRMPFSLTWGRFLQRAAAPAFVVGALVGGWYAGDYRTDVIGLCCLAAVGCLMVGHFTVHGLPRPTLASFMALIVLGNWYIQASVMPRRDPSRADKEFLQAVDRELPPGETVLAAGGPGIARHIFYLERPVAGRWEPKEAADLIANENSEPMHLIARAVHRPVFEQFGPTVVVRQSAHTRRETSPDDRYTLFRIEKLAALARRPESPTR
jgi:4-amino-4-deoxy-L-arabinose transferase-like glycosyltransferase